MKLAGNWVRFLIIKLQEKQTKKATAKTAKTTEAKSVNVVQSKDFQNVEISMILKTCYLILCIKE